jgi:hypothetical protein
MKLKTHAPSLGSALSFGRSVTTIAMISTLVVGSLLMGGSSARAETPDVAASGISSTYIGSNGPAGQLQ